MSDQNLTLILQRLQQMESLIAGLEAKIGQQSPSPAPAAARPGPAPQVAAHSSPKQKVPAQVDADLWGDTPGGGGLNIGNALSSVKFDYTMLMGLAGVGAMLLAVIYLIALALDGGWLTPTRQVGLAGIVGVVLISAGFLLPGFERYRSMLPAAGLAILYMAVYGGHVVHDLFKWPVVMGGVGGLTLFGLGLGYVFRHQIYAYVAMVGCYLAPMALHGSNQGVATPATFYLVWTLLFGAYALFTQSRAVYIVAGYFALLCFDLTWRMSPEATDWPSVVGYQFLIFLMITATAVRYSVVHQSPLTYLQGMSHLPLISIFYGVQYYVLADNTTVAPWVSLSSAAIVAGLYLLAKSRIKGALEGGALITSYYCTLVVVHAGFFELVPERYILWSSLLFLGGMGFFLQKAKFDMKTQWPLVTGFTLIFMMSCFALMLRPDFDQTPGINLLHVIYAIVPYTLYGLASRIGLNAFAPVLLYLGHVNMMGAIIHFSPNRLIVSVLWIVLAMATMAVGYQRLERHLARSALLIFAASALKLLIYDLSGTTPLIRIGCLIAVGVSLYAAGWFYRKIDARIG